MVIIFPSSNIYVAVSFHTNENSNTLKNITRRLIGQGQKFANVYSVIYCRKPDVMSNVDGDWST